MKYMMTFSLATSMLMVLCQAELWSQTARTLSGESTTLKDLDPNDGVDFVSEFSGTWSLKFSTPAEMPLVHNEIIDGGSRTTYAGVKIVRLRFQTDAGLVSIIGNKFHSELANAEYTYWDRADFGQHIIELCFDVGLSNFRIVLTADSSENDLAFGQLFDVNSPNPNSGRLNPVNIVDAMDAELNYSQPMLFVTADSAEFGATGSIAGNANFLNPSVLLGDVNLDGVVSLLDIQPFLNLLITGQYQEEADING